MERDLLRGQEIYLFFYRFGIKGIIGILFCNFLMGVVIYKTLNIVHSKNIKSYKEFLETILKNNNKYLIINRVFNIIINFFLVVTFIIMVAGFGAYFSQEFRD